MSSRIERYVPLIQTFAARTVLFHVSIARRAGLNATELNCFRLVARAGGATATELARNTGLTLPAMTSVVDRLEQLGFVRRERDTEDRRRVVISAEKKASARVDALYADYSLRVGKILDGYEEAEFEFLLRYLQDVGELLQQELSAPVAQKRGRPRPVNGPAEPQPTGKANAGRAEHHDPTPADQTAKGRARSKARPKRNAPRGHPRR